MLKGILFVIAIIITFDIGKALFKSWKAEEDPQAIVKEEDDAKPEQVEPSEAGLEELPVLLNLDLPEETIDLHSEEFKSKEFMLETEPVESEKNTSPNFNSSKEAPPIDRKISLNAKPIVAFDEDKPQKLRFDGASVDIKVKLD